MIAMARLAILRPAEVADHAAVGTVMILMVVVVMRMWLITMIVRMDDGLREGACRGGKARAEGRGQGKHESERPSQDAAALYMLSQSPDHRCLTLASAILAFVG